MKKRISLFVGIVAAGLTLSACFSGGGSGTIVISSDLPLQGSSGDSSRSQNNTIRLYLEQLGNKITNKDGEELEISFKEYDDSIASTGAWDDGQCSKNASDHVANKSEVAVVGTYNSGCAKVIVPILNQDPDGPMTMISPANTNPGLTKPWDPGEPEIYYPTGQRNYGRVVGTDDFQGAAGAQFAAKELKLKRCFVLNDNQTYGQGVARAFADAAPSVGITVVGYEAWDAKQANYSALFNKIKAQKVDCVYFGGIFDNNGAQLTKDKFNILGDNKKVKLIAPDGFSGYPDFQNLKEAQGTYISFMGLPIPSLKEAGGVPAQFLKDYEAKYGGEPVSSYSLYAGAALQVILEGIKKSDGTRKGITEALFGTSNTTVSADISLIGKAFTIDARTGDIDAKDCTFSLLQDGSEEFYKAWKVE